MLYLFNFRISSYPEMFMCLVAYARANDPKFEVYRKHYIFELYKLGMLIDSQEDWEVHPSYAIALEEVIQELLESKTTPSVHNPSSPPLHTHF